ncbi:MAG TPA: PQQ-binding-like beta-propeller repeat protein, partial [Gemmata sp.]|nr:PQQ-binding-like beta-propeller repeat protein [Gemmata sp.]
QDQNTGKGGERYLADASPSLTASGDRLYVRGGPSLIRPPDPSKNTSHATEIVCLRCSGSDVPELQELWRVAPPQPDEKTQVVWEGAPLVSGRRMWAAYTRFEGGRIVQGIACFDPADSSKETGAPRAAWSVDVCDSPQATVGDGRARQELLTFAGRNVVFNSNAGAVVALDALTGRRAWGFRYPRGRKADSEHTPHPAPAVACDGRVFVAPVDAEHVYSLDAETGKVLWESRPTEGARIIGVATGRLVVEVSGPPPLRSLRGLSLATGSYQAPEGWIRDAHSLIGYGRGFVTDDIIAWPTRSGLFFLNPEDGSPAATVQDFRPSSSSFTGPFFGNVVYADGVMVVVTPTQIWAYLSEQKRYGESKSGSTRDPRRGEFERAVAGAEAALRKGDLAAARMLLLAVARGDLPRPLRAWAVARILLITPKVADEEHFSPDLHDVLTEDVRKEWVIPPDGVPATVGTLLDRCLGREPTHAVRRSLPSQTCEWKLEDAPSLTADAVVERTKRFSSTTLPLRPIPGASARPSRSFLSTADGLIAVPLSSGNPVHYFATNRFTHAAEFGEGFVVAGPFAVSLFSQRGTPEWTFLVPTTEALPAKPGEFRLFTEDLPPRAELTAFHLAGPWLVALWGDRHLIAFDLQTRRVAWVLGADGISRYQQVGLPGAPRFGSQFLVSGRLILAQVSNGTRSLVSLETGRPLASTVTDQSTAAAWWTLPPAELDVSRVAVSDAPGTVRLLDLATGRISWVHEEEREASLTGEPPQVRAWGDAVMIAVRRNHGVEIDRLDAADGSSLWTSGPAFVDSDRVNLAHADADSSRIYIPTSTAVIALGLKRGQPAWKAKLPDTCGTGGWVVKAGRECVIVYPEFAIPREPVADVLHRAVRSLRTEPGLSRLPGLAAGLYDAWVTRTVPVFLLDPESGKQLSRFDIPAAGPHVTAWFERDLAVIATGDRVCWFK